MVQRFNTELERDGGLGLPCLTMRSSNIGEWVRYEDYAKLEELYAAAVELMVSVHNRYNTDASPALQEMYEKASGTDEPRN